MLHLSVSCRKRFVFERYVQRVMGAQLGRGKRDAASWVPTDGVHGAPRFLQTGRARPHTLAPGSHMQGERGAVSGKMKGPNG
jgi:hypothetical protein